ncbi:conserved unknown protein [Ectocarpus siliculosus]|uniref:ER membrane protein complex subunit 7 beta-sandwich domain-containing protein n=1 Tax=Ectocarpus siliculosus TaxID=2880 RepID=D7FL07_ECTSI|nr:conserved unknown protein [Ectocarpus siliculosus]|eukprot:CBJ29550.1 conserved unknown protein [Ectocarpus siliculosus]
MPDRSVVPTTKVVLNGGQHSSLTARDGSFAFRDVAAGVYLLEVLSPNFHFSAMKIKVDDMTGIIAIEYKYPGAPRKEAIHPLLLTAHTKWNHFEKREGMKVGGMFKSPMTIIMVLSMAMMFFLPKMMANLDPEQLEEIKDQQKAVQESTANLSFSSLLSNALAGQAIPQQQQGGSATPVQRAGGGASAGSGSTSRTGGGSNKKKHRS